MIKQKKVFVGLSGGVDSATTAAILKKEGHDVTGVFLKTWQPDWLECSQKDDRRDAMRAAAYLGIPFITIDCEEEYKSMVVDYMIEEYRRGRTPNPDVMCNSRVKFGVFLEKAMEMGAGYVATGHYSRVETRQIPNREPTYNLETNSGEQISKDQNTHLLLKGVDENKDQSYFLWNLTRDQLSKVIFPLGEYTKPQVRVMAQWFGLPNANKKDSQGVCFLGKFDLKSFLSHYIPAKRGAVLNTAREEIGTHDGAWFYTRGQRHGFNVALKAPNEGAHYVVAKDVEANTITVATKRDEPRYECAALEGTNWLLPPEEDRSYRCRTRHRAPCVDCSLRRGRGGKWLLDFNEPQKALAPGQSIVVYDGDVCLGGGVIS